MELPIEQASDIWKPHIEAQATSGLSGKAYCEHNDLNYNRFCYQKRKHQSENIQSQSTAFIPVSLTGHHLPCSGLTVTLPNGISISGIDNQFPEASAALIRALL